MFKNPKTYMVRGKKEKLDAIARTMKVKCGVIPDIINYQDGSMLITIENERQFKYFEEKCNDVNLRYFEPDKK